MPLDPQFRTVLDTLESKGLIPLVRGDAAETRAHYRRLALRGTAPQYVPEPVASATYQHSPGGVPVRVYEPLDPRGSTLIFLHGGGWVVGDVETHDPLCRRVTNGTGARVVSVDYRLAPEHPFPAGLDDAEEVLHWLWTEDPGRPLGVAGDSAGASLTAGVALRARDKQIPLAAQLMLYPAIDPAMTSPSFAENGAGYFLTGRDMAWFYQQYLPGGPGLRPGGRPGPRQRSRRGPGHRGYRRVRSAARRGNRLRRPASRRRRTHPARSWPRAHPRLRRLPRRRGRRRSHRGHHPVPPQPTPQPLAAHRKMSLNPYAPYGPLASSTIRVVTWNVWGRYGADCEAASGRAGTDA